MKQTTARLLLASIALSTTVGVLMHDSHLDVATITALARREASDKDSKISPELHTHSEHLRLKKTTNRTASPDPRDQSKNRQKKTAPRLTKGGSPSHVQYS